MANVPGGHGRASDAQMECTKAHEDTHATDPRRKCPPPKPNCSYAYMQDRDPQNPTTEPQRECPAVQAGLDCMKEIPRNQWDGNLEAYVEAIRLRWEGDCRSAGMPLDFGNLTVGRTGVPP